MDTELVTLNQTQTWVFIDPPTGVHLIGTKWVYKIKRRVDGSIERYKAQLVAKDLLKKKDLTALTPFPQWPK